VIGIGIDWSKANWYMIPPPVYLTNWGFFINTSYFLMATLLSLHALCSGGAIGAYAPHEPPRPFHKLVLFMFETTLILETLIVVGFWALVYTGPKDKGGGQCSYTCYTVHGAGQSAGLCFETPALQQMIRLKYQ